MRPWAAGSRRDRRTRSRPSPRAAPVRRRRRAQRTFPGRISRPAAAGPLKRPARYQRAVALSRTSWSTSTDADPLRVASTPKRRPHHGTSSLRVSATSPPRKLLGSAILTSCWQLMDCSGSLSLVIFEWNAPAPFSSSLQRPGGYHFTVQIATLSTETTCLGEVSLDSQSISCLGRRSASFQNWCERENVAYGDLSPRRIARHSRGRHHTDRRLSPMCSRAGSPGPTSHCRKTCGFAFYRCTSRLHGG